MILGRTQLVYMVFVIGYLAGSAFFAVGWFADELFFQHRLEKCGYQAHPFSDVAWELYRRNAIPVETAAYYSHMVKSENDQKKLEACMSGTQ